MRFFYNENEGKELTGINFTTVRKVMDTGGSLSCFVIDPTLSNLNNNFGTVNERVEIRRNDGSTVLWEGVVTKCTQNSQPSWRFDLVGQEGFKLLERMDSEYNATLYHGTVTSLADDTITDRNAVLPVNINGKHVIFTDVHKQSAIKLDETAFPGATSDWYYDGAADDPANVETKTTVGNHTDLSETTDLSGNVRYWEIYDTDNRGLAYYGITMDITVPNEETSSYMQIIFDIQVEPLRRYANVAARPVVQIFDVTAGTWEDTDVLNAGDITGLGRLIFSSDSWIVAGEKVKGGTDCR